MNKLNSYLKDKLGRMKSLGRSPYDLQISFKEEHLNYIA